jgi:hypothetical protein
MTCRSGWDFALDHAGLLVYEKAEVGDVLGCAGGGRIDCGVKSATPPTRHKCSSCACIRDVFIHRRIATTSHATRLSRFAFELMLAFCRRDMASVARL